MAFIEMTENQVSGLMSMITNENNNESDINQGKTETMPIGDINSNSAMKKVASK